MSLTWKVGTMNKNDVLKIFALFNGAYATVRNMSKENKDDMITFWVLMMQNQDVKEINQAVMKILRTSPGSFSPSVSDVLTMVHTIRGEHFLNDYEAWDRLVQSFKDGNRHSTEEYEKLPLELKFVTPDYLKECANKTPEELAYEKNRFLKDYSVNIDKMYQNEILPPELQNKIKGEIGINAPAGYIQNETASFDETDLRESPTCVMCGYEFKERDLYILHENKRVCLPCKRKL